MPPTVPLETLTLTLHVPRTIADAAAASILRLLKRKSIRDRLRKAVTEVLKTTPAFAPVTVTLSLSP